MLEQYYHINKCIGVSILLKPDGTTEICACSVSKHNAQVNLDLIKKDIPSLSQLYGYFEKGEPIAMNLFGKGILTRQISKEENIDKQAFHKVLPNAELNDFYIQNFISGEYSFISAIRKTDADKWITQLSGMGFNVLALSLGPFPVQQILGQLNSYGGDFVFNGHNITRNEEGHWTGYQYKDSLIAQYPIKLGVEQIDEKALVPYAAAFQLILSNQIDAISADVTELQEKYQATVQQQKIKTYSFIVLGIFFFALLANYLVLAHLNAENLQLSSQMAATASNTDELAATQESIAKKEALLKTVGWDGGINKAALIDQIAALLPPEVTWKEISVNPVDLQQSRLEKTMTFKNRRLHIVGTSQRIVPVNEWIARIKTKTWVKSVQLEKFVYDTEENNGLFNIDIDY